jgi:hypothetical protein
MSRKGTGTTRPAVKLHRLLDGGAEALSEHVPDVSPADVPKTPSIFGSQVPEIKAGL